MVRFFLAAVGIAYLALAAWCSIAPGQTSKSVGFDLQRGSGQSEFLTVYGGLETALGIVFLYGAFRPSEAGQALLVCLVVHGCLVAFRTVGFFYFSGIPTTTYLLAATEWIIFLGSATLFTLKK